MNRGEGRRARAERVSRVARDALVRRGQVMRILAAALLVPSMAAGAASAEPASPLVTIDSIQLGFAGHYKVGFWTPIEITLTGQSSAAAADVEVVVPDGDGVPTSTIQRGVGLAAGKTARVRAYVKIGRSNPAVTVVVHAAGDPTAKVERTFSGTDVPPALASTQRLILQLGGKLGLGSVTRFNEEGQPEQAAVATVADPSSLPDRWYGYDGVDITVLTTADPAYYEKCPAASLAALHRWMQLGGRLMLSVGSHGDELLSPGKPLERFAPGRFLKTVSLDRFAALESFSGASQRIAEGAAGGARPSVRIAELADVHGRVEAFEGSGADKLPLVVRSAEGFGELIFVAVDLAAPPLDHWPGLPQFVAALLGRNASGGPSPPVESAASHLGYSDLSGQLRAALDQFPDVRVTPFWLIFVLAGGYVLLLFPLDYLLRRRKNSPAANSAAWPWLRFGAIIFFVSLGAWWLGRESRGDRLQIDQADVVDFDAQSGLMRGNTWFSVFSPDNAEPTISLAPRWHGPHAERSQVQLSWLGLPGSGLGGMGDGGRGIGASGGISPSATTTDLPLFTRPYPVAPPAPLGDSNDGASIGPVPLAAGSSKCFTGEWINEHARLVEADLFQRPDHQLAGTIRLTTEQGAGSGEQGAGQGNGSAALRLHDCVLFFDRWAYLIPKFSAADPIDVQLLDTESETADTYFTRRKLDQTAPYNRAGLDRRRVLEIMMFYRAAGGLQYVGLSNRYQHFLDLSGQLGLDRAILIGLGPPASVLTIDGQPVPSAASAEHVTIYRFVLPVRTADSTGQPAIPTSHQLQP